MVDRSAIQKHMEVKASDGTVVGRVDDVEGDRIKLTKTDSPDGQHHYVDVSQVARVDEHVHLSTTRDAIYGATAAGTTGVGDGSGPLPPILNRQADGAEPRGNFYLPWIVGAIGLILLLLLLSRCFHNDTATAPVATQTTETTTEVVGNTSTVSEPTVAGVSTLGTYLGGTEVAPRTFNFEKLNFDTGKATIRSADQSEIGQIATAMKQYNDARVRVVGYADARGSAPANDQLGQQRADAVKQALVAQGIDAGRVETASGGESAPVDTNATSGGRFENRRTELIVTAK